MTATPHRTGPRRKRGRRPLSVTERQRRIDEGARIAATRLAMDLRQIDFMALVLGHGRPEDVTRPQRMLMTQVENGLRIVPRHLRADFERVLGFPLEEPERQYQPSAPVLTRAPDDRQAV